MTESTDRFLLVSLANSTKDSKEVMGACEFNESILLIISLFKKLVCLAVSSPPSDTHSCATHTQTVQVCTGMICQRRTQRTLKTFFPVTTYTC